MRGDQIAASPKPHPLDLDRILPKIMSVGLHTAEEWGTGVGERWNLRRVSDVRPSPPINECSQAQSHKDLMSTSDSNGRVLLR